MCSLIDLTIMFQLQDNIIFQKSKWNIQQWNNSEEAIAPNNVDVMWCAVIG